MLTELIHFHFCTKDQILSQVHSETLRKVHIISFGRYIERKLFGI